MESLVHRSPTIENLSQLRKQKKKVNDLLQKQEIMWRQRFRVDWLREGDQNTKFFHGQATMRKRKNKISKLKNSNGDWVYDHEEIERMANDYYSELFTTSAPTGI